MVGSRGAEGPQGGGDGGQDDDSDREAEADVPHTAALEKPDESA